MWPELVGDMLEAEIVVNLGESGSANTKIIERALENITDDVDLVIIGLTELDRVHHKGYNFVFNMVGLDENLNELTKTEYESFIKNKKYDMEMDDYIKNNMSKESIKNHYKQLFSDIISLQNKCDDMRIPCIFVSLVDTSYYARDRYSKMYGISNYWTERNHAIAIFESEYYDILSDYNILGWPFNRLLGGWNIFDTMNKNLWCTPTDPHPNEKGQEFISVQIFEYIQKTIV